MNEYYLYEYEERFKYLTNICLNLTDACNLRCKYCFVHQQPHYMTYEVAKDAIDWVANNLKVKKEHGWCNQSTKFNITFFGGEPMLMFEQIIKPIVDYIEKTYINQYALGITTNGTLLNEDKIKYLYDHNIIPLLSIDGNKYTQDLNRPCADQNQSSFDLVQKNIPYILKYFPNTTFRSTIDEDTVAYTFENYIFAEQCGFKNIFMIPNGRSPWKAQNLIVLQEQVEKIFNYRIHQYLLHQQPIQASFIDKMYSKVKENFKIFSNVTNELSRDRIHQVIRCGLGTGSGSIGYNGNIYGCQEQDSYAGQDSLFYLGNIYNDGIEPLLHDKLLNQYAYQGACKCENRELCYNCNFKNLCYELNCPSSSQDCFHAFDIASEVHCGWFNILYKQCLLSANYLLSQHNSLFQQYFQQQ